MLYIISGNYVLFEELSSWTTLWLRWHLGQGWRLLSTGLRSRIQCADSLYGEADLPLVVFRTKNAGQSLWDDWKEQHGSFGFGKGFFYRMLGSHSKFSISWEKFHLNWTSKSCKPSSRRIASGKCWRRTRRFFERFIYRGQAIQQPPLQIFS